MKMNIAPLPKWVGVLGLIATTIGSANEAGLLAFLPHPWGAVIAAVGGFVTLLSHSLTGTGGKPTWETPEQ
jgi:hypothetical protein